MILEWARNWKLFTRDAYSLVRKRKELHEKEDYRRGITLNMVTAGRWLIMVRNW